jgi:hypothetical protein
MLKGMSDLPIACTLDAAQLRDRVRVIDALVSDALIDQEPIDGGLRTRFHAHEGIEGRVRELVAGEARCCAFLTFAIGHGPGELWLDITGPAEARPVIDQFFATVGSILS